MHVSPNQPTGQQSEAAMSYLWRPLIQDTHEVFTLLPFTPLSSQLWIATLQTTLNFVHLQATLHAAIDFASGIPRSRRLRLCIRQTSLTLTLDGGAPT